MPAGNEAKKPRNIAQRWMLNALTGKYFQQHAPVRKQTSARRPFGAFCLSGNSHRHAGTESGDQSLLEPLESIWDHMVSRRMYVTGGIGSLPALEGFGNDYELDPEFAYAETCAALGSMFWNWQMTQLTGKAQYADLFEWQLYNASRVGMGADGTTYLYNNPLTCRGGVTRKAWYEIPCCPSNISRTWADIGMFLYTNFEKNVWVHQYVDSEAVMDNCGGVKLKVKSGLPWQGKVTIEVTTQETQAFCLHLRITSWTNTASLHINNQAQEIPTVLQSNLEQTASGYDPRTSSYHKIERIWTSGDVVELDFNMDIQLRRAHPKVKRHMGKAAISAGPLVYCLESVDNPNVDIFNVRVDPNSLSLQYEEEFLGGCNIIIGKSTEGVPLTFIPYYLWGNRGASQMTVWVNV